jgi:hypothetical protein
MIMKASLRTKIQHSFYDIKSWSAQSLKDSNMQDCLLFIM